MSGRIITPVYLCADPSHGGPHWVGGGMQEYHCDLCSNVSVVCSPLDWEGYLEWDRSLFEQHHAQVCEARS